MAERERIARLLYEAHYPNGSVAWGWFQTSEATRQIHRDMADALLAAREGAQTIFPWTDLWPSDPQNPDCSIVLKTGLLALDGYINDLRAQLTTARARMAELERKQHVLTDEALRFMGERDALTRACTAGRDPNQCQLRAQLRAERAEARIAQLEALTQPPA